MDKKDEEFFSTESMQELGNRVFAAVISHQLGNALLTEYKKIKADEYGPVSPVWAMMGWTMLQKMTGNLDSASGRDL